MENSFHCTCNNKLKVQIWVFLWVDRRSQTTCFHPEKSLWASSPPLPLIQSSQHFLVSLDLIALHSHHRFAYQSAFNSVDVFSVSCFLDCSCLPRSCDNFLPFLPTWTGANKSGSVGHKTPWERKEGGCMVGWWVVYGGGSRVTAENRHSQIWVAQQRGGSHSATPKPGGW